MVFVLLFLIVLASIVGCTITIVQEQERIVIFRLGRVMGARGPGPVLVLRGLEQIRRVGVQVTPLEVVARGLVTRDGVRLSTRAVAYVRVVDPVKAIVEVENYRTAAIQVAQATLRARVGQATSDVVLGQEEQLNASLTQAFQERIAPWGLEASVLEIKDVEVADDAMGPSAGAGAGRRDEPAEFGDL